jgi:phage shock protein PspC (stress-responsive transcriptional regulator)
VSNPSSPVRPALRRRTEQRLLAGVAGGLADWLNAPVVFVRLVLFLLAGYSSIPAAVYAGAALVVPARGHNRPSWDNLIGAGRVGLLFLVPAVAFGSSLDLSALFDEAPSVWIPVVALQLTGRAYGARLASVHPHLPAARGRLALVVEVVRAAPAELGVAQVGDTAEHGRDPAARPADRILDLREGAGLIGRVGQRVQQLAHEVAAAVVEAGDIPGSAHRVLRRVLAATAGRVREHARPPGWGESALQVRGNLVQRRRAGRSRMRSDRAAPWVRATAGPERRTQGTQGSRWPGATRSRSGAVRDVLPIARPAAPGRAVLRLSRDATPFQASLGRRLRLGGIVSA